MNHLSHLYLNAFLGIIYLEKNALIFYKHQYYLGLWNDGTICNNQYKLK